MLFVFFLLLLFLFFILYRKNRQQLLQRIGIKGPKSNWFFGNIFDPPSSQAQIDWFREGTQKFGRCWGYYEGTSPCIVLNNLDDIRGVFVKKSVSAHKLHVLHDDSDHGTHVSLFNSDGARWRRLRLILNPGFSTARLRAMYPFLQEQNQICLEQLEAKVLTRAPVDVANLLHRLSVDIIGQCVFGIDINAQIGPEHALCEQLQFVMKLFGNRGIIFAVAKAFSPVAWFLRMLLKIVSFVVGAGAIAQLHDRLGAVIKHRMTEPANEAKQDILQLLVEALKRKEGVKQLTYEEAISQAMIMLFAGVDTTSAALTFCFQALSRHPDVQKRLQVSC